MKLLHYTYRKLSLLLLLLMAVWGVLFYYAIIDEVMDETDDTLENYSEILINNALMDWCMIRPHLRGSFMRQVCAIRSPTFTFHYRLLYLPMVKYPWRKKNCWKICTKQTAFDQRFQIVS